MTSIQSPQPLSTSTAALTPRQAPPPYGTPLALVPAPAGKQPQPGLPNAANLVLKRALGDQRDWQALAQQLNQAAQCLAPEGDARAVASVLAETLMEPHPDASYYQAYELNVGATVDLESFLIAWGVTLPTTRTELVTLARAATDQSMQHPFGNFGGALSWPLPLSPGQQEAVHALIASNSTSLPGLPLIDSRRGTLGYLINELPLSEAELQDPAKALERLLHSPRAQALGQTLQTRLNGIATETSVNDYVLAAIQLGLDAESISAPGRNKVAGFDLAQEQHWGQSPASVVSALSRHLVSSGKTSAATAMLGAHLLLARVAPQFLVRDIPENVLYGSQSWTDLCLAVAKIEARTPGATPNMNFAQVMSSAHASDTPVPEESQKAALVDWGVANGIFERKDDNLYSSVEIERVLDDYNFQLKERAAASSSLATPIPDLKEIALAKLEEQFGKNVPFEDKCITADYPFRVTRHYQGTYSMLDIAMMGQKNVPKWKTSNSRVPIDALNKDPDVNVFRTFKHQFDETINAKKKGLRTTVQHLISQLPLADRKNLEFGKVDFYQDRVYTLGTDFLSSPTLTSKSNKLLIKTERNTVSTLYEIDLGKGAINRLTDQQTRIRIHNFRNANRLHKTQVFQPTEGERPVLQDESPASALPPQSFSPRTRYIADAFVKAFDLDNADILKQARGVTTFDQELASREKVHEFLLNLVPLRSAIVNFRDGNYVDGVMDLGMDLLGFLTAGAGAAAKVGKVLATGASSVTRALKAARVVGVTAIEAFNPLSGVGDLTVGAGRLAITGAKGVATRIQTLRGAPDSYDLVAASQKYEAAATGTFTFAGHQVEGAAVRHNGNWYAYDQLSMQPYGSPLEAFDPVNTLMPPSPDLRTPQRSDRRFNPYQRERPVKLPARPTKPSPGAQTVIIKTDHLPVGEYVSHIQGAPSGAHFTPSRKAATRDKFKREMNEFYQSMTPEQMPKRSTTIPEIPTAVTPPELIEKTLDLAQGAIFGENHTNVATLKLLYDNVDLFKRKKVRTVFIEGFIYNDDMRLKDDGMGKIGPGRRPPGKIPTLEMLLKKLKDNGIEAVPLDHFYLTRHADEQKLLTGPKTPEQHRQRLEEFNYYATRTIQQRAGEDKWIALVGRQHISTTQGVLGLGELTGGTSIAVYQRAGLRVDYGVKSTDIRPGPLETLQNEDITGDLQMFVKET